MSQRAKRGLAKPPPERERPAPGNIGQPLPRERGAAREALVVAARAEFDECGFEGTDTNRIARRAGYAPQTFYRNFADKTAIFVETYQRWLAVEWMDLAR